MTKKEENKIKTLLKLINDKIADLQITSSSQIALDYWNEKRVILQQKLLDLEFDKLDLEADHLSEEIDFRVIQKNNRRGE